MKNKFFLFFLLFSNLFFSCRKETGNASWDMEVLTPLINTSLDINKILPDSLLQSNTDSSLKIIYENEIYRLSMDTLFKIPDTIIHQGYNIPIPLTLNPGQILPFPSNSETTYQLPGIQLRTVIIKSGYVRYTIKSYVKEQTTFAYSIPSAKLNNVPFSLNITVPAAVGSSPGVFSQTYDLSGYSFNLTGIANNKVNTLHTTLTASISPLGQPVLVNPSDSLIIDNVFYDLLPYYAKGYFGQNTFNAGPSQTDFTLFNRIKGGSIRLEDVKFNLKIENPIGMDARVTINKLSSINTRSGNTVNLSSSVVGSAVNINRASEGGGNVYPTYTNIPLTTSNSNIKSMIENLPDKFGYDMQIKTNPLGNISGANDFIYADKLLNALMNVEIPLSLVANNLTLTDTVDFNVSNNNNSIHGGTFTLFVNNGFPFNAAMQMYLLNENNIIVDSLMGYANTIDAAPVNSSYRVISKKLSKIIIPIEETRMDLLFNTKKIMLKIKFDTDNQPQYMKIYSDYNIDVRVVGDFNYTIQLH